MLGPGLRRGEALQLGKTFWGEPRFTRTVIPALYRDPPRPESDHPNGLLSARPTVDSGTKPVTRWPYGGEQTVCAMVLPMRWLPLCFLLMSLLPLTACHDRSSAKDFASWCWRNQKRGGDWKGDRWLIYKYGAGPRIAEGPILLRPYLCANIMVPAKFAEAEDEATLREALRKLSPRYEHELWALVVRAKVRSTLQWQGGHSLIIERLEAVEAPAPAEQDYLRGRFEQAGAFDSYTDELDGTPRPMPTSIH